MSWQAVWTDSLNALTQSQKEENVRIIYSFFHSRGWTDNAIAAMLGNQELEGQLNPAQWENGYGVYGRGFGLSQWTPYTKLSNWLGTGWETNYTGQLRRIEWEAEPQNQGVQWMPYGTVTLDGETYNFENYTFQQFAHDTTHTLKWLVACYEQSYERGTPMINTRYSYAQSWLTFIQGISPSTKGMPLWMMCKPRWKR